MATETEGTKSPSTTLNFWYFSTYKRELCVFQHKNYLRNILSIDHRLIAVGVFSVLGVIYAAIRGLSFRRRESNLVTGGGLVFMKFALYILSALSFAFLVVLIGTCFQWLFFFKQQTVVYRLLPVGSELDLVKGLFIAAFIMKFIDIIQILGSQLSLDIFFIDWERPRGRVVVPGDTTGSKGVNAPISIMRTLFVANEWRELQTMRRIKPTLLLILVLFTLKVIGFEHLTTTDPVSRFTVDPKTDYVGEQHFCLRIAVNSIVFLTVAVLLWVIFGLVYERFFADSIGDFIDFCSLSNVSIFIVSHRRFGYYIHGRSVHGRADTSLHELYEQFKREEDNLCGKRGLEPNSDLQTFEMSFTEEFRQDYEKVMVPLATREQQNMRRTQAPASRQNPALPGSNLSPVLEKSVAAYSNINRFLSSFIEHSIQGRDYVVRNKTLLERVFDMELQEALGSSVFYNDEGRSFSNILLYGQEWSLVIFNLLFFSMVDWIAGWDYVLATVCTYFVDVIIVSVRDAFGKKNLAKKTMVDERFLI